MHQPPQDLRQFQSLIEVMTILRSPTGCPWDQEQTHTTLAPYAIEEAHELAEAIESGQTPEVVEELGDLLLQVVFHAELGRLAGAFTLSDVIEGINTKMVRRHPHVFGDLTEDIAKNITKNISVQNSDEVLENWSRLKEEEKKKKGQTTSSPFKMPAGLPALQRALKMGQKTKQTKFDWPDIRGVQNKLEEELRELDQAILSKKTEDISHEIGDVLFTIAQLARHLDIEPEQSLRKTNARFEKRYLKMMELVRIQNLSWDQLSDPQKEELWSQAKRLTAK